MKTLTIIFIILFSTLSFAQEDQDTVAYYTLRVEIKYDKLADITLFETIRDIIQQHKHADDLNIKAYRYDKGEYSSFRLNDISELRFGK